MKLGIFVWILCSDCVTFVQSVSEKHNVSVCNGDSVDFLLCEPGWVVNVTQVLVSNNSSVRRCSGYEHYGCEEAVHAHQQYHIDVIASCDGKTTCTLTSRAYNIHCLEKSRLSSFTTIEYICLKDPEDDIQISSKCSGSPFNDVECPGDIVDVVNIYVGKQTSPICENGRYNISADCLQALEPISEQGFEQLYRSCESATGCKERVSKRYAIEENKYCWRNRSYETDYTLVLYKCVPVTPIGWLAAHNYTITNAVEFAQSNVSFTMTADVKTDFSQPYVWMPMKIWVVFASAVVTTVTSVIVVLCVVRSVKRRYQNTIELPNQRKCNASSPIGQVSDFQLGQILDHKVDAPWHRTRHTMRW